MSTEENFEVAARRSAEGKYLGPRMFVGTMVDREIRAHVEGWHAAREYLQATANEITPSQRKP